MFGSLNFHISSLGSIRLSDPTKLGPSAKKTASAAMSELSWEFRDSSHGDGLSEGLDGVRRWVWLGIVPTETPRFTQIQGPPCRR
jgi:hypothetical protein